jgi:hypothetical protein
MYGSGYSDLGNVHLALCRDATRWFGGIRGLPWDYDDKNNNFNAESSCFIKIFDTNFVGRNIMRMVFDILSFLI